MYSEIIVGRHNIKIWTRIFVLLQFSLLGLIIACLAVHEWIYSDIDYKLVIENDYELDFSKLECGIVYCYQPEYRSYSNLIDRIDTDDYSESEYDDAKSLKEMLQLLNRTGVISILFYVFTLIALLVWFISMVAFLRDCNIYICSWICSIFSCASFWVGSILWFVYAPSRFNSCGYIPDDNSVAISCTSSGPILSIVIMIIFPFITVFYLVVSIKAYSRRNQNQPRIIASSPQVVQDSEEVQNNIPAPNNRNHYIHQSQNLSNPSNPRDQGNQYNNEYSGISSNYRGNHPNYAVNPPNYAVNPPNYAVDPPNYAVNPPNYAGNSPNYQGNYSSYPIPDIYKNQSIHNPENVPLAIGISDHSDANRNQLRNSDYLINSNQRKNNNLISNLKEKSSFDKSLIKMQYNEEDKEPYHDEILYDHHPRVSQDFNKEPERPSYNEEDKGNN